MAGAGGVALRGALALDPERYETTIFTGTGDRLLDEAAAAGFEIVRLQHLIPELSPVEDRRGLQELRHRLRQGRFDVVHTHSAKAGALGRMAAASSRGAANRAHVPWLSVPRVPDAGTADGICRHRASTGPADLGISRRGQRCRRRGDPAPHRGAAPDPHHRGGRRSGAEAGVSRSQSRGAAPV